MKKLKFYFKVIRVPIFFIILTLVYWIYCMFFPNPIPQFIPNVNEVCLLQLFILVSFTIYEINDYSKVYDEYSKESTLNTVYKKRKNQTLTKKIFK